MYCLKKGWLFDKRAGIIPCECCLWIGGASRDGVADFGLCFEARVRVLRLEFSRHSLTGSL